MFNNKTKFLAAYLETTRSNAVRIYYKNNQLQGGAHVKNYSAGDLIMKIVHLVAVIYNLFLFNIDIIN